MSGVLLGPKTAEAAARFFGQPPTVHGPGLLQGRRPAVAPPGTLHVMTPSGGIPARSGFTSGTTTYGQASCEVYREVESGSNLQGQPTGEFLTVYNDQPAAVGGSKLCQVKYIGGYPFVDVEPCNA